MPDKKPSRRIKPVVEEIDSSPPSHSAKEVEPEVKTEPVAPPQEVVVDEKQAKKVLEELESAHSELKKSKRKINLKLLFGLTILVALVVGFLAGGLYVYTTGMSLVGDSPGNLASPTPTPQVDQEEPTPQATATPEPVDISKYSISVLNGSGKIGEAGKVEDILVDAGFKVGNTGNASRYNYTDTVIQVKKDVPQPLVSQLEEKLSESYSVETGDTLPDTSQYDVVVTVGSKAN